MLFRRSRLLNRADRVLFGAIVEELNKNFKISRITAAKIVFRSNFIYLVKSDPIFAHHECPVSWAVEIYKQNY